MSYNNNGFEKLIVWQKSVDFSVYIYQITDLFPEKEKFGLTSQLQRASISVASNIAEGSAKGSKKEFVRFLLISLGSCAEIKTQIAIANKIGYLNNENYKNIYGKIDEIGFLLVKLKNSLSKTTL
jgi:four helix bundle protein